MAVSLLFTACEKEFEPAADPQAYPQEDARALPNTFTVNPVGSINIAAITDKLIQVGTLGASTLPADGSYGSFTVVLDEKVSLAADEALKVSKEELQDAVAGLYGKRPTERTIKAVVKSSLQIEGQGFVLNSNEFEIKVTPEAPILEDHYYYIGAANGWSSTDKSFELTNKSGDYYENPVITVTIPAPVDGDGNRVDNWFKIAPGSRYESEDFWDGTFIGAAENGASDYTGKFVVGHNNDVGAFNIGPGTEEAIYYSISIDLLDQTYTVKALNFPNNLYMIGDEFGGWEWSSDGVVELVPVLHNPDWGAEAEGQFWTVRYFTANKGFKFCSKRAWDGDFWGLDNNEGFTEVGGNCTVAEDGFYLVHIDMKNSIVHVEPARVYGIGDCFGGWNEAMEGALFNADGKKLKATTVKTGEVRMYVASSIATSDWWTREFVFFDGKIAYRGNGGDQARVKVLEGQTVTLDFNAGTAEVAGEGVAPTLPENLYMIGDAVGGWVWAENGQDMIPVNGKEGHFWAIRFLPAGKGFKFNSVKDWGGDFAGLGDNDSGFTVSDGNCFVAEDGVYMIYVDLENEKICVEPAKVYGIGDCFGGWNAKMEDALFTATSDGKLVGTTKAAGNVRIYAESSIAVSDWWTREFVFYDGKIAYRGTGGDQEAVAMEAGKKITLDFNVGTAVVE